MSDEPQALTQKSEVVSRSQIKREAEALQQLGRDIYRLPKRLRATVRLNESLTNALDEADRIKNSDALKRHFQYVGKLLRDLDEQTLDTLRTAVQGAANALQGDHTRLQGMVNQLIEQGRKASETVLAEYPNLERQHLNQLIRNAVRAEAKRPEGGAEPTATRKLKQYLASGRSEGG